MKTCRICHTDKAPTEYYTCKGNTDGLEGMCKSCKSQKERDTSKAKTEYIRKIKSDRGCEICGFNSHPAALQLDHLDPSTKHHAMSFQGGNSSISGLGWKSIKLEISKCRVLCANCHMIHTDQQRSDGTVTNQRGNK